MTNTLCLIFAALCAALGQFLFKLGATGKSSVVDFMNLQIVSGLLFYGLGTIIWIFMLSKMRLVDVYAFTALTFVLVYAAGVIFLNERVNMSTVGGVFLVLGGLFFVTRGAAAGHL